MDHSLIGASTTTHLKIVVAALVDATLVVIIGIAGRLADDINGAGRSASTVIKAGQLEESWPRPGGTMPTVAPRCWMR